MFLTEFATTSMRRLYQRGPVSRFGTQYLLDAAAWIIAVLLAVLLRFDGEVADVEWLPTLLLCLIAALLQLCLGFVLHLYRGRFSFGSFAEVRALASTVGVSVVVLGVPVLVFGIEWHIPRSAVFIAAPIAFLMMAAIRYVKRVLVERGLRPNGEDVENALIFGAGYLGAALARRMLTDRNSPYLPVGLIDDDPLKRNFWVDRVRVLGTLADLKRVAENTSATTLVIAIARADAAMLTAVSDAAKGSDLRVKVLPMLSDILAGKSRLRDLRDVSIEDLIGRHPVDTEIESIAGYLRGKRVLVTGAGGSIGSELCRQISEFGPAELIMLDRDETGLQSAQISISGHGLLDTRDVVLADIRDFAALQQIFRQRQPEVVFHAAALKHLPMLEQYPDEGWKTNVLGTLNVLRTARKVGVETFVNVSTDKAANPTSVLGHSKRVAEKLTAWAAEESGRKYLSVRFGNVLGSRGSMLPTFTALIEAGGPVTVTHPEATRYFMTIPEACQLVIQAGGIGRPGEVLILDMGEPVRILDVAERMIAMSGRDIAITFTGLREGEKLHEELVGEREATERPFHPKISHARVNTITPARLDHAGWLQRIHQQSLPEDASASEGALAQ